MEAADEVAKEDRALAMRSSLELQARVTAEPYRRLELSVHVPMAAEPSWAETQPLQKQPRPRAAEPLGVSVPC